MPVHIGTSGWQYRHWRERFYPKDVAQKRWLEYYADRFHVVESNNAFYMLPKPETFQSWAERTPDDFVMAVKVNRYVTHIRRLRDPHEPVGRFLDNAGKLGGKLGPALLQLPPNLKANSAALEQTLACFDGRARVAVEFRHETWFTDEVRACLQERGAALCLADRGSRAASPIWRTAEWTYLRFHEGRATPQPCYGKGALARWAERVAETWGAAADVYVFFNNDPGACALRDAQVFAREAERVGLEPTRVPSERVEVG